MPHTLTAEQRHRIDFLESKGWVRIEDSLHFNDPTLSEEKQGGGLGLELAYREQYERDRFNRGLACYRVMSRFKGYGHCILERRLCDGKITKREVAFNHDPKLLKQFIPQFEASVDPIPDPQLDTHDYRQLLVTTEKHGPQYFQADTLDQLNRACVKLFQQRLCDGYWYSDLEGKLVEPAPPAMNAEQVKGLPEGPIRKAGEEVLAKYQQALKDYRYGIEDHQLFEKAKAGVGYSAIKFIFSRADYQYEGVTLEDYEKL